MSMKDGSDANWKSAWEGLPKPPGGPCPPLEAIAGFVGGTLEGPRKDVLLQHLSTCAACRQDVVAARTQDDSPVPAALRLRLYRLLPGRISILPRLALSAAVLVAIAVGVVVFWPREQEPAKPVIARPKLAPPPKEETRPLPEPRPEPTERAPDPVPPVRKPDVPPLPDPITPRVPPPQPIPDPPVIPIPVPVPDKPVVPAPAPEKPIPEPTRVALKGSVIAIAGSCASQMDGEAAAQPLRPGQKRDFAGTLKLKADVAAAKVAIGSATYYVQRGGEISVLLEEGRTKVQLARGEAFFDVTPGKGRFLVDTALGTVTVTGTRFLVSAEKAETEVVVQRGAVEFNAVAIAAGERSAAGATRTASPPQKADLARRLSWLRPLEESILIETDQMALQGGMIVLPDPTALGGRAIGIKTPLKAGQDAVAEIAAKRKQSVPYVVWIRLHWAHGVPSAATLSVGDALTWSSKGVVMSPNWQWIRVGTTELPEDRFRVRLTDTQPGMRIDQILITSDPELNPENK
jgi:hypothetical protein